MRVLVVDDSAFMRRAITKMIESEPGLEVIGTARDGEEAVAKAIELRPDVITLDIEMPVMDGLTALRQLRRQMREDRPAVLICSSQTRAGSLEALKALRFGAADFITKDHATYSPSVASMRDELVAKIKAIGSARTAAPARTATAGGEPSPAARPAAGEIGAAGAGATGAMAGAGGLHRALPHGLGLVVIASSTGGPPALEQILMRTPPGLPAPVIIAQHMPAVFTQSLADRLDQVCAVTVVHAEDGMPALPGCVYIAPGGRQTRIRAVGGAGAGPGAPGRMRLIVNDDPPDALYRPCATLLFQSAAAAAGPRTLGLVLTGMGEDGAEGAAAIRAAGGAIATQTADTCVVYGMPRAVDSRALSCASLSPQQMARALAAITTAATRAA